MANQFRRTLRPGVKRATDWSLAISSVAYAAVAGNSKVAVGIFSVAQLAAISPGTLIRSRGRFAIATDNPGVAEDQIGAVGFTFVNAIAGALGVTAIPGPGTDPLWDGWFFHQFFSQRNLVLSAIGVPNLTQGYDIDSKAMRKFDGDHNLAIMVENTGSTGFVASIQARFLIKNG